MVTIASLGSVLPCNEQQDSFRLANGPAGNLGEKERGRRGGGRLLLY